MDTIRNKLVLILKISAKLFKVIDFVKYLLNGRGSLVSLSLCIVAPPIFYKFIMSNDLFQ